MIMAKWQELRALLVPNLVTNLIIKAWDMKGISSKVGWIRFDKLEEMGTKFCIDKQFNPDTTLMVYEMPKDNPNGDPVSEEIFEMEEKTLSLSNHTLCTCSFFKDMTLEKMASSINQIHNMKAFL